MRNAISGPRRKIKGTKWPRRVSLVSFIPGMIMGLGILTWSSALGSHLTLPGSQDLSHGDEFDPRPIIRQLEKINNYIPPQAQADLTNTTSSKDEHSSPPTNPLHRSVTEFNPVGFQRSQSTPETSLAPLTVPLPKKSTQDLKNSGWRSLLNGRPNDAIAAYRESIHTHPKSAEAYLGMGIAFKSLGFNNQARDAIQQALELNPLLSSAHVHLGYLYADGHVGDPDLNTARRLFSHASQLGDPFASIALLDLKSRSRRHS
jgi:tetratricopeptide (TPR) repeat protein